MIYKPRGEYFAAMEHLDIILQRSQTVLDGVQKDIVIDDFQKTGKQKHRNSGWLLVMRSVQVSKQVNRLCCYLFIGKWILNTDIVTLYIKMYISVSTL